MIVNEQISGANVSREGKQKSAGIPCIHYRYDTSTAQHVESTHHSTGRFIKGPIPFAWIQAANGLGGKVGSLGLALWYLAGLKSSKYFKLTAEAVALANCSRPSLYGALESLENAKLISVNRRPGQRPWITILKVGE